MESTEFRLLRHNRYLKYVLTGFAALLLFVSMTRGGDLACAFNTCVVFPGGKMTPSHASEVINSCDKFTDRNAGAYAIKMSQSEINDIYMKYSVQTTKNSVGLPFSVTPSRCVRPILSPFLVQIMKYLPFGSTLPVSTSRSLRTS